MTSLIMNNSYNFMNFFIEAGSAWGSKENRTSEQLDRAARKTSILTISGLALGACFAATRDYVLTGNIDATSIITGGATGTIGINVIAGTIYAFSTVFEGAHNR